MKIPGIISLLVIMLATVSCTRSLPSISHAHIGHSLTAWHDTPNNEGLFVVAEKEALNAFAELRLAHKSQSTPDVARQHIENIVHSLNPEVRATGTGLGYGAIKALQGAVRHIEFSSDIENASLNNKRSADVFAKHASSTTDLFLLALAQARLASSATGSALIEQIPELDNLLLHAIYGNDLDHNGIIGNNPDESGLVQLRAILSEMVANEVDPPYTPIGKKYLFGLVRLPDGNWVYKFAPKEKRDRYE